MLLPQLTMSWVAAAERMQELGELLREVGQNWHQQLQALLLGLLLGTNLTDLALDLILEVVNMSFKPCGGCHYPLNMVSRQGARERDGGSTIRRWERAWWSGCHGCGMWDNVHRSFGCPGGGLGRCRGVWWLQGDFYKHSKLFSQLTMRYTVKTSHLHTSACKVSMAYLCLDCPRSPLPCPSSARCQAICCLQLALTLSPHPPWHDYHP